MWKRIARYAALLLAAAELMTSVFCPVLAETIDANTCVYGTAPTGMDSTANSEMEGTMLPEGSETVPAEVPAEELFFPGETMNAAPFAGDILSDAAGTLAPVESAALGNAETFDPASESTGETFPLADAVIPGAEEDGIQETVNEDYTEDGEEPETVNQELTGEAEEPETVNQELTGEAEEPETVNQEFTGEAAEPETLNQELTGEAEEPETLNQEFTGEAAEPEEQSSESEEDAAWETADSLDGNDVDPEAVDQSITEETAEPEVREDVSEGINVETAEVTAEETAEEAAAGDGEPGSSEESDAAEESYSNNVLSETAGQDGNGETADSILPENAPAQMTESEQALGAGQSTDLSEPSGLSVFRQEDGDYTLYWNPVNGASGYQIYLYHKSTNTWGTFAYCNAEEGNSHTIYGNGLSWGESRYTVSAVDESNRESTYGENTVSIYSVPTPYGWLDSNYSQLKNSYTFNSYYDKTQVSGVEIYRRLDSGNWTKIKTISVSEFGETTTKAEDVDIIKAGTYCYRARFYFTAGPDRKYGAYSETVMEKISIPDAEGIYTECEGTKVRVRISYETYGSNGAFDSLEVYRKYNSGSWGKIKTIKRSGMQFDDYYCSTGFTNSISGSGIYYYRFRFCLGTSKGKFSDIERVYCLKNPVIRSLATKANKITLKWAGDNQATGWHIELADNKDGHLIKRFDLSGGKTAYTIDLNKVDYVPDNYCGNILLLRIFSDNKHTSSNSVTRKCIFLERPKIRGSVSTNSSSVGLTWNKIIGASGYKIYRYNNVKKKYILVSTVEGASKTTFTDKNRKAKAKYTYRIQAYKLIGSTTFTSALSNVCDVWTLPKQSAIKIVNTLAGKKIKPRIKRSTIPVKAFLRANGGKDGSWSYCSEISEMIDYKGFYNIVYPVGDYLIIKRMKPGNVTVVKTIKIKRKLEKTGGVICDAKGNYYVAWGKDDSTEKGSIVTFAISKYDYSGRHKGTCAYTGKSINTKQPFALGNCAMTMDKDLLVCHFARRMYQSDDGLNHQASQCCFVNTKTMKKANPGGYFNYNSHSFDQRILTRKGGGVLYTDLGDAYPRGIKLNESGLDGMYITPFHFYGGIDNTFINAQLGDVVELSTGYMIVGASGKSLKSLKGRKQLFIQIINPVTGKPVLKTSARKGTCRGESVKDTGVKWLTNYTDGSYVYNVQAAGMEGDRVVIMWERAGKENPKTGTDQIGTYYMVVSASGTVLQKATRISTKAERMLNGSEELQYKKGNVYWSTCGEDGSGHTSILTYKMNVTQGMGVIPDEVVIRDAKISGKGAKISWKKADNATHYYVYRKYGKNGEWKRLTVTKSLSCTDQKAVPGKTYYYTVKGYNAKEKVFGDMDTVGIPAK